MKKKVDVPVLYEKREDCCGCTACYSVCPAKAIKMIPDSEGFEYPMIDEKTCIGCLKCISVCPCHGLSD